MNRAARTLVLVIGLIGSVVVYVVLLAPLEALLQARGHGIVALELAWTRAGFEQIVADWGQTGVEAARQQIWRDFAFIPSYLATLWAAVSLATRGARAQIARWATWLARAMPVAALLDIVENVSLLRALDGQGASGAVPLASACATVKFAILGVVVLALVAALAARRQRPS